MIFKDEKELKEFYKNSFIRQGNETAGYYFIPEPAKFREYGKRLFLACAKEGHSIDTLLWTLEQLGWDYDYLEEMLHDIDWLDKQLSKKE